MREHQRFGTSGGPSPQRLADDRGQVLPIVALVLWLIAGVALALALLGGRAVDRSRAQAAADAVALGVAAGGAPEQLASRNSATVQSLVRQQDIDVIVAVGEAVAGARARLDRPVWEGLDVRLQRALSSAETLLGEELIIVSGRRSRAEQEALWARRAANPYPVAAPGTSLHERGLAVDVALEQAGRLAQISHLTGVCQPLPLVDPVHFILCQTTPTR